MAWTVSGLAVCTLLCVLVTGYHFGIGDQDLYLPFVYHWIQPALFQNDYLLRLAPFAEGSVFWRLLALSGAIIPVKLAVAAIWGVLQFLTIGAVYQLGKSFSGKTTGWLTVLLWIPVYSVAGSGIATHDQYLTTRAFGLLIGLWILKKLIGGEAWRFGILLVACVLVHVVTALPLLGGLAAVLIVERRWADLVRAAGASLSGGVLLLFYARNSGLSSHPLEIVSGERFQILWRKLPDVFPQGWPLATWRDVILTFCILGLLILSLFLTEGGLSKRTKRILAFAAGASAVAAFGGFMAIFKFLFFARMTLIRGTLWVVVISLLLVASQVSELVRGRRDFGYKCIGVFCLAEWMTSGSLQIQTLLALALCGAALLRTTKYEFSPSVEKIVRWAVVSIAPVVALLQMARWLRPQSAGDLWSYMALPFAVVMMLISLPLLGTERQHHHRAFVLVAAFAVATVLFPPSTVMSSSGLPIFPVSRLRLYRTAVADADGRRTYDDEVAHIDSLVRERVPIGSTVIVSPRWGTFRLETLRSSFVTFKDRSGALFSGEFAREWLARMRAIRAYGDDVWRMDDSLNLTRAQLLELADRYSKIDLDYIVTRRTYELPLVADAGPFKLYRLTGVRQRSGNDASQPNGAAIVPAVSRQSAIPPASFGGARRGPMSGRLTK